jgi:hypothetical protein
VITDCGREYPESLCIARNWTRRETTPDQQNIERVLVDMTDPQETWLHIGIGNSSLAKKFADKVKQIDGISISPEEVEHAKGLGIINYHPFICNKYSHKFDYDIFYDVIIDNNPTSHCCCHKHLMDYLNNISKKLQGLYLTDSIGLVHAEPYAQGYTPYEFEKLITPLGMEIIRFDDSVIMIVRV